VNLQLKTAQDERRPVSLVFRQAVFLCLIGTHFLAHFCSIQVDIGNLCMWLLLATTLRLFYPHINRIRIVVNHPSRAGFQSDKLTSDALISAAIKTASIINNLIASCHNKAVTNVRSRSNGQKAVLLSTAWDLMNHFFQQEHSVVKGKVHEEGVCKPPVRRDARRAELHKPLSYWRPNAHMTYKSHRGAQPG